MALVTSARRLRGKNTGPADALPAECLHFASNVGGAAVEARPAAAWLRTGDRHGTAGQARPRRRPQPPHQFARGPARHRGRRRPDL
jgi:hypothetical protein